VNLFFIMSGYVLCCKPLAKLHAGHTQAMYESIASSVFRRAMRLFLPTMAAMLFIAALSSTGCFQPAWNAFNSVNQGQVDYFKSKHDMAEMYSSGAIDSETQLHLMRELPPPMADSIWGEIWFLIGQFSLLVKTSAVGELPFHVAFDYDHHAWTIPVEFKSSMTIFTLLIGTSMLASGPRLLLHAVVAIYCLLHEFSVGLFIAGMVIAEIDLLWQSSSQVSQSWQSNVDEEKLSSPIWSGSVDRLLPDHWNLILLVGMFILSVPYTEPVTMRPYSLLAALVPDSVGEKNRTIRAVGAVIVTWSCVHSGLAAPVLNSRISQYLGKISFAL
jgi:peptidoglycan/LPS O-acetylase OafA/YrhL